jgi:integrase/recombinase XerD
MTHTFQLAKQELTGTYTCLISSPPNNFSGFSLNAITSSYIRLLIHLVFPAIYRLLYGCGLRISETLALKQKDMDLKQGIITIRGSKFNKDRLIPMSPSLTRYLETYSLKIHQFSIAEDIFFMKKDKTAYAYDTVYKHFRKMLRQSGISHGGKGRGPRLHDLRHTFAVHSLNQMVRQGNGSLLCLTNSFNLPGTCFSSSNG